MRKNKYRTHTCAELRLEHEGQEVRLSGWVAHKRDKGGIIFLALRDHYGQSQIVFTPDDADIYGAAKDLRLETVIKVQGIVVARPEAMVNDDSPTGAVEIRAQGLEVLGPSDAVPFPIVDETNASEAQRLRYRFLERRGNQRKQNRRAWPQRGLITIPPPQYMLTYVE